MTELRRVSHERACDLLVAQVERERLERDGVEDGAGPAGGLRSVTGAFDAARVPYIVVPGDGDGPWRVVVPRHLRRRSMRAIHGLDDRRHADGDARCRVEFRALDHDLPDHLWRWRWEACGDDVLHGPAVADTVEIGGRRYPTGRSLTRTPRADQVTFPIDAVYTWVDGGDPGWLAAKQAALRRVGRSTPPSDADDPSRYRSHDELRYSLRSLATFADFVRRIFLVTDGQVPSWLDIDHPRITVVDHRDIFPDDDRLPTFNSHAIESRLHHIDGLAEHYLYFNDDFFLGRPIEPERFFHANGMTKFFPSRAHVPATGELTATRSVDAAAQNTRSLIQQRFGRLVDRKIKHAPYPQRRSVLFEMEHVLSDEFARTAASRLRSAEDIPVASSLFHYYAYLTGRAVPANIASHYISLGGDDLRRALRRRLRRRDWDVLCVNDAGDAHVRGIAKRSRLLRRFMASYWPTPSPFEHDGGTG